MSWKIGTGIILSLVAVSLAVWGGWYAVHPTRGPEAPLHPKDDGSESPAQRLEARFTAEVRPVLERYCFGCHGSDKPEADLDLSRDATVAAIMKNARHWNLVRQRLQAEEMPPEDALRHPRPDERAAVIAWLRDLHNYEPQQNAGDPGPVLAHRLNNAEFDYTIRDLTGIDMRPTREFPVDPANQAGFDNSGESLVISQALVKKYLAADRLIADHVVLKPDGFVFAAYPVVTETDRDKYCVQRILDFYQRHPVDLADYFYAAWKYRYRAAYWRVDVDLSRVAADAGLSAKYLALIWSVLTEAEAEQGPLAAVRKMWSELPEKVGPASRAGPEAPRPGCDRMRDLVVRLRKQLKPNIKKLSVNGISPGSQPFVLWNNRQQASRRRAYSGEVVADFKKLAEQLNSKDAGLADLFPLRKPDADTERQLRGALERFCMVFPDAFVVSGRGPYFNPNDAGKGRPLTAGFHLMQGYFRDDQPLCDLILDDRQRQQLDALWFELDFITLVPMRQYKDFIFFERAEPPRFMFDAEFDFARSEDKDATSEEKMNRLAKVYLAKARAKGAGDEAQKAIETYFADMSEAIRRVERAHLAAEASHLEALVQFTERAYRRPLAAAERDDLLAYYHQIRKDEELSHEEALRQTLVSVLMSPHFCYRFDLPSPQPLSPEGRGVGVRGSATRPLSDYALASRLSYFLWSSMPDAELLAHAAAGDLHELDVLTAQTRRMLRDPKVRGLATEFGGNWLDFRRFEELNTVDRQRFPSFTNELRQAMFEEPIRYFVDMAERNRSVLDLLYGNDTFVNRPLAKHYGMTEPKGGPNEWVHVEEAQRYGRGGLLPMSVFLTKNAPGLRTSPVKRGYWAVRRLLGEQIPPPPPKVPELPKDEANLGALTLPQVLARHRDNPSCAACHRRFDSVGLVFENFGPIGERRAKDLGGRPVETTATFPDGAERDGLAGLRAYLRDKRQDDYLDNLCRKLFSYALARGLLPTDKRALDEMRTKVAADHYAFGSLVEAIVTSPQFQNKRGRDDSGEQ